MRIAVVLSALLIVGSCGGDESGSAADTTSPSAVADTTPTTAPTTAATTVPSTTISAPSSTAPAITAAPTTTVPAPAGAELVGRWAHYDVVAYEDGTIKTLIISYGFNDFSLDDEGRLVDQASFCFSEQRTDPPLDTSLSDAATQAIQPPPTPVEVGASADGTLTISRPATPTPVGIVLDDPAIESLPTGPVDPDDPRLVDADGDGQPGITVTIRVSDDLTGELYIARREIFAYDAELTDPDTLEGVVTDRSEQLVIGASDPIFLVPGDGWVQHPDLTKSPVLLRRVEPDWDCERLAAERDALFPPTPSVDW